MELGTLFLSLADPAPAAVHTRCHSAPAASARLSEDRADPQLLTGGESPVLLLTCTTFRDGAYYVLAPFYQELLYFSYLSNILQNKYLH